MRDDENFIESSFLSLVDFFILLGFLFLFPGLLFFFALYDFIVGHFDPFANVVVPAVTAERKVSIYFCQRKNQTK